MNRWQNVIQSSARLHIVLSHASWRQIESFSRGWRRHVNLHASSSIANSQLMLIDDRMIYSTTSLIELRFCGQFNHLKFTILFAQMIRLMSINALLSSAKVEWRLSESNDELFVRRKESVNTFCRCSNWKWGIDRRVVSISNNYHWTERVLLAFP